MSDSIPVIHNTEIIEMSAGFEAGSTPVSLSWRLFVFDSVILNSAEFLKSDKNNLRHEGWRSHSYICRRSFLGKVKRKQSGCFLWGVCSSCYILSLQSVLRQSQQMENEGISPKKRDREADIPHHQDLALILSWAFYTYTVWSVT